MTEEKTKTVEKYYIEVSPSAKKRFIVGLLGGIGWGLGVIIGSTILVASIAFFVSKIDFVPILGKFLSDILQASQSSQTPIAQ